MSIFHDAEVECPCGQTVTLRVWSSANVCRHPDLRGDLEQGRLNRVICVTCGRATVVAREMIWSDLDHDLFIGVFPVEDRGEVDRCVKVVEEAWLGAVGERAPDVVHAWAGRVRRRVVFGYEALLEKVLCFEHGVDDRVLEAWKAMTLALSTDFRALGITDLVLKEVDETRLILLAVGDDGDPRLELHLEREALVTLAAQPLAAALPGLFEGPFVDHRGARPRPTDDRIAEDALP